MTFNSQGKPWTSDLSVKEWLLTKKVGFQPLGQVMGTCVYHIGYAIDQSAGTYGSGELNYIQKPYEQSRQIAIQRLENEARALGADAVVGVKFLTKAGPAGMHEHVTEFIVFGTAVKITGYKNHQNTPLLCTVSGQELVQLINAGALPVGLVIGISIYYKYTSQSEEWTSESFYNRELRTYSQAVQETRRLAMNRMKHEASRLGANGILAHDTKMKVFEVEVTRVVTTYSGENELENREDHILEFIAIGTAIRYDKKVIPDNPETVLDLSGHMREITKNNQVRL